MNRQKFYRHLSNIPGWRTKKKIIVFESDDWGSIRMPSKKSFSYLKNCGVDLESYDKARYNIYDTLARQDDLEHLFEVLENVKDINNNPCVFTAVSVVANPDFVKIKESGYKEYSYEPFTRTLSRYYPAEKVFDLWKEGISRKLFIPQFHGREHLNIIAWLKNLQMGHKSSIFTFNEGVWGFVPEHSTGLYIDNQAAFQLTDKMDLDYHKRILVDGLNLFESIFGYRAEYFVPPNGSINNSLNTTLCNNGIRFRSTAKIQHESIDLNKTRKRINWLGKKDKSGIRYITRNCFFEPGQKGKDWIDSCLNDIQIAFRCNKPAIISTHRVNYIGVHHKDNRNNSLHKLKSLLAILKKKWPDIEFMSTNRFGNFMNTET